MPTRALAVHLLLYVATWASTTLTFAFGWTSADRPIDERLGHGLLFGAGVMAIMTAHEAGHWFFARRHGVESSLPYFIPLPLGFGTMGAVIRLRGRIPHRDALVDIGASGPLWGLAVALPLLCVGYALSTVAVLPDGVLPDRLPSPTSLLGLVDAFRRVEGPAALVQVFGDNLLTLGVQRLVIGPLAPNQDVYAHPVLIAAWFGLLVTMLNLAPVGQLDGGHVAHALFGERARRLGTLVVVVLLGAAFVFSASWAVWALVVGRFVGVGHPEVAAPEQPLSPRRRAVAWVTLAFAVLTFMPMPLGVKVATAPDSAAVSAPGP